MEYECMICIENFPESEIIKTCDDKHTFCKTCLHDYLKTINEYNNNDDLLCPYCKNKIEQKEVNIINGKKEVEYNYVNDTLVDSYKVWDENSQLRMECNYTNGIKEYFKEWDENDELLIERFYIDGI